MQQKTSTDVIDGFGNSDKNKWFAIIKNHCNTQFNLSHCVQLYSNLIQHVIMQLGMTAL